MQKALLPQPTSQVCAAIDGTQPELSRQLLQWLLCMHAASQQCHNHVQVRELDRAAE
jgi:hypothetical protein